MGWSLGYDSNWERWIGYGVPAYCDYPGCREEIDRGLAYVCCEQQPHGGERGCGLYFCGKHHDGEGRCDRCAKGKKPYKPSPEHLKWIKHRLTDKSWKQWRMENPDKVRELTKPTPPSHKPA